MYKIDRFIELINSGVVDKNNGTGEFLDKDKIMICKFNLYSVVEIPHKAVYVRWIKNE